MEKGRTDTLSPEQRRHTMSRIRSKDTKLEMKIRRLVHGMGYRYRLHRSDLPGKPDLVLPRHRKVIFVHGCFWHSHDCAAGRKRPKSNKEYWLPKLQRNKDRDAKNQAELKALGWGCLVIWGCQTKEEGCLRSRVAAFLKTTSSD